MSYSGARHRYANEVHYRRHAIASTHLRDQMAQQPAARDLRLDNAKGALIFLVVLGLFLEATNDWTSPLLRFVLTTIYILHMPAFIFLAGITARKGKVALRVSQFATWLIVFQSLYAIVLLICGDETRLSLFAPFWILWYLMSMAWWTLTIPVLLRIRRYALSASLALSLSSGLVPFVGYALSTSRTLVFLPFFVAGALYGVDLLELTMRLRTAHKLALLITSVSIAFALFTARVDNAWLYGSRNYADLGVQPLVGVGIRFGILLASSIAVLTVISIMSARRGPLTQPGEASLSIYLFHGVVVLGFGSSLSAFFHKFGSFASLILCIALSAVTLQLLKVKRLDQFVRSIGKISSRLHSSISTSFHIRS